jgi:hypothetical protein
MSSTYGTSEKPSMKSIQEKKLEVKISVPCPFKEYNPDLIA